MFETQKNIKDIIIGTICLFLLYDKLQFYQYIAGVSIFMLSVIILFISNLHFLCKRYGVKPTQIIGKVIIEILYSQQDKKAEENIIEIMREVKDPIKKDRNKVYENKHPIKKEENNVFQVPEENEVRVERDNFYDNPHVKKIAEKYLKLNKPQRELFLSEMIKDMGSYVDK